MTLYSLFINLVQNVTKILAIILCLQNEARKLNHVEVVEEDKRNKLPANWETRKKKVEWELAEEEAKKVTLIPLHSKIILSFCV